MKKLTQDDFKQPSCPRWVASAAVDGGGIAWGFQLTSEELEIYCQRWVHPYGLCVLLGTEYDATNWQHSAIDREVQS